MSCPKAAPRWRCWGGERRRGGSPGPRLAPPGCLGAQHHREDARGSAPDASVQDQANLESERQKMSAVVRNLQRELEESAEETGHWRDMFQKNKDELRSTKQE